jgi:hypothetical protein
MMLAYNAISCNYRTRLQNTKMLTDLKGIFVVSLLKTHVRKKFFKGFHLITSIGAMMYSTFSISKPCCSNKPQILPLV